MVERPDGKTPRAFVCGFPITHSRSPLIHNYWLRAYGLPGSYEAVAVEPGRLDGLFDEVRQGRFVGGNVTIPLKEEALRLVDRLDADAQRIGAVNTVWMDGETLVGGNTDAYGFAANLDDQTQGWPSHGPALVLGAGGAARAVVSALVERGVDGIRVLNRTHSRAETLASEMGPGIASGDLDALPELARGAGLIVNTTSLGLNGKGAIDLDVASLRRDVILADIVYVPLQTAFIARGRAAGLCVSDGLGMLLHQAVPGFERWFKKRPVVDGNLRRRIEADIEGKA